MEIRYFIKILKDLSIIHARLINQYKLKYQTVFSARFDNQDDDNRVVDETKLFIILNINHNLAESDLDKIEVKSSLEHQIQQQETTDGGWRFDTKISLTVYFYKTGELKVSKYVKFPLRSNAFLNIQNNDKNCFLWSISAFLHPCNDIRVTNYKQYYIERTIQGFDFANGFKCSDVHKFNELNNLSISITELIFYQDQNKWKLELIPIEVSKLIQIEFLIQPFTKNIML